MEITLLWPQLFVLLLFVCSIWYQSVAEAGKEHESGNDDGTMDDPHREPSLCEVCKFLTTELKERLDETGKSHEVLETGHAFDQKKKRKQYRKSELRLIEALSDPHVCNKILEYNIHAERKGSLRFAKGTSQTFKTLHNLVNKGVNVDLGIPYELWDSPSAGVTSMQRTCFKIVEDYEEDIEEWYLNSQEEDLTEYLCRDRVLKSADAECLYQQWPSEEEKDDAKKESRKSSKKEKKDNTHAKGDNGFTKGVNTHTKGDSTTDNSARQGDVTLKGDKDEL